MLEKAVVLLLLLLIVGRPSSNMPMRSCNQTLSLPASCMDSTSVLRISRDTRHYELELCFNSLCELQLKLEFRCNAICADCESIFGTDAAECRGDQSQCESQVVVFISNYCASSTTLPITQPGLNIIHQSTVFKTVLVSPTCTSTVANQCTQLTSIATVPTTLQLSQTFPETETTNSRIKKETNATLLIILGVLFGLSVTLLAVVTTAWVWTLWTFKKHRSEEVR